MQFDSTMPFRCSGRTPTVLRERTYQPGGARHGAPVHRRGRSVDGVSVDPATQMMCAAAEPAEMVGVSRVTRW
jgi:hypothetical protein